LGLRSPSLPPQKGGDEAKKEMKKEIKNI